MSPDVIPEKNAGDGRCAGILESDTKHKRANRSTAIALALTVLRPHVSNRRCVRHRSGTLGPVPVRRYIRVRPTSQWAKWFECTEKS
jgi:hypothetical protein